MFTGLRDVDWSALEHAYSSAEDVPDILRGLASDDAAEREWALDAFYGAVHHQGNVYDSTVACLPFLLELAANPGTANPGAADRGQIVELITSICVAVDGEPDSSSLYQEANALIRERAGEFISWMTDDDGSVRSVAAFAVAACVDDEERVFALFRERLDVETDAKCRNAVLRGAAILAARASPAIAQQVVRWLEQILGGTSDPATRLAALVQVARLAPDRPPESIVSQATELLREVTDSPTGELLEDLSLVLDDRVPERVALIEGHLRHADPDRRVDALRLAGELMRGWRGSYSDLVTLIGAQLTAPEPEVRRMASLVLQNKFELAAPAADALAERVAAAGSNPWNSADPRQRGDCRDMVVALARLGDERVLPILEAALTQDEDSARMLGGTLAKYRAHADRFVPRLRTELHAYAGKLGFAPIGLFGLLSAARDLGAVEAVPEMSRVLEAAVRRERDLVMEVTLKTLASFGPAAAQAYDVAAGIAGDAERFGGQVAVLAIEACRSLRGEAEALLPLLEPWLHEPEDRWAPGAQITLRTAAEVAGAMGRQAEPVAGRLRTLMESAEDGWVRVESAVALIRVTGPAAYPSARPVLEAAWQTSPHARVRIAECVRDLGAVAESFHSILRAEMASPYRHGYAPGVVYSEEVRLDELLLTVCAQALAGSA